MVAFIAGAVLGAIGGFVLASIFMANERHYCSRCLNEIEEEDKSE